MAAEWEIDTKARRCKHTGEGNEKIWIDGILYVISGPNKWVEYGALGDEFMREKGLRRAEASAMLVPIEEEQA